MEGFEMEPEDCYEEPDDGMTDVEADADALASAGWGTDEDYGFYGDDCGEWVSEGVAIATPFFYVIGFRVIVQTKDF